MMKIFCEKILTAFRRKLFCEKLCCRCLTKLSIFHISICHIFLKKPIILIEKPVILIEKPIILIEKPIISMCNSHFDKKISFSNWKPTFTFPIAKKKQTSFESKNLLFWSRVRKLHVFNASVFESAVGGWVTCLPSHWCASLWLQSLAGYGGVALLFVLRV